MLGKLFQILSVYIGQLIFPPHSVPHSQRIIIIIGETFIILIVMNGPAGDTCSSTVFAALVLSADVKLVYISSGRAVFVVLAVLLGLTFHCFPCS